MKPNIFTYLNYRDFARDSFQHLKNTKKLTLRDLARKAGFNTHTFFANVIAGTRSLTAESATKVAKALELTKPETRYFELLVRFDNARTVDEKNDAYGLLAAAVPRHEIRQLNSDYYELFRHAHVLTIRELVALPDFKADPQWIARRLHPRITAAQAEKAIEFLLSAGLLQKNAAGKLEQAHKDLTTGPEVRSLAIALYHKQLLQLAADSIDTTAARNRDISSLTLNISQSEFEFIKRRVADMRREILDFLSKKREGGEEVMPADEKRALYYLNVQLFNATELRW